MLDITANTTQLRSRIEQIRRGISETSSGPIADGLKQAGAIYLGTMRRRFEGASRGDGTWPDLAESTKRGRLASRGPYASAKRAQGEVRTLQDQFKAANRVKRERAKLQVLVLRSRLGAARILSDEHRIKAQIRKVKAKGGLKENQSDLAYKSLGKFAILADTGTLRNSLTTGSPGHVETFIPSGIRVGTNISYATYHQNGTANGRPPKREILVQPDEDTERRMLRAIEAAVAKVVRETKPK